MICIHNYKNIIKSDNFFVKKIECVKCGKAYWVRRTDHRWKKDKSLQFGEIFIMGIDFTTIQL